MKFKDMPYKRVDFDKVAEDMKALMAELDAAKSGEEQFAVHKKFYALYDTVATNITIAQIRHDVDTADEFYGAEQDFYDEKMPELENLVVTYKKKLYESPYKDYLVEKIGPVAFKNIELSLKSFDAKLIPLMQEENALVTEYAKLIASAKIDWEGEELNLSLLRPYTISPDRQIRQKAWDKMSDFFEANADKLDEIYDKLVKNRDAQAKALGYDNYVTLGYYRMQRNCYGKDEVENFRNQIKKDFVPFAEKLHDRRSQESMNTEILYALALEDFVSLNNLLMSHTVFCIAGVIHNVVGNSKMSAGIVTAANSFRNIGNLFQKVNMSNIIKINGYIQFACQLKVLCRSCIGGEHNLALLKAYGIAHLQLGIGGAVGTAALFAQNLQQIGVRCSFYCEIFFKALVPGKGLVHQTRGATDSGLIIQMEGRRILRYNFF